MTNKGTQQRDTQIEALLSSKVEKTVRVEYDATRLDEPVVHQLLRRSGLDIVEKMPMFAAPVPQPVATT